MWIGTCVYRWPPSPLCFKLSQLSPNGLPVKGLRGGVTYKHVYDVGRFCLLRMSFYVLFKTLYGLIFVRESLERLIPWYDVGKCGGKDIWDPRKWPFPMVTVPSSGAQTFRSSTHSLFFALSSPHRFLFHILFNTIVFLCFVKYTQTFLSSTHSLFFALSSPHRRSKTAPLPHPL